MDVGYGWKYWKGKFYLQFMLLQRYSFVGQFIPPVVGRERMERSGFVKIILASCKFLYPLTQIYLGGLAVGTRLCRIIILVGLGGQAKLGSQRGSCHRVGEPVVLAEVQVFQRHVGIIHTNCQLSTSQQPLNRFHIKIKHNFQIIFKWFVSGYTIQIRRETMVDLFYPYPNMVHQN